jgi:hypothetical protein
MQTKNSFLHGCLHAFGCVIIALCFVVVLYWGALLIRGKFPENNKPIDKLEAVILALPDSQLKNNLFTVLASEYAGDSNELHELLQEYSKIKIKQLEDKNSL